MLVIAFQMLNLERVPSSCRTGAVWQQRQPGGRAGHLGQPQTIGQLAAGGWSEVGFGHPQAITVQLFLHLVLPASTKAVAGAHCRARCAQRCALQAEAAALLLLR